MCIRDRVWQKRVNYFATVGVSGGLALLPVWHLMSPPTACVGPQCLLSSAIYAAGALLPAIAQPWIDAFAATPGWSVAALAGIVLFLGWSKLLQTRSRDDMRALWEASLGLPSGTTAPRQPKAWIRRLRQHPRYQRFFQWLKWTALPAVAGIALLVRAWCSSRPRSAWGSFGPASGRPNPRTCGAGTVPNRPSTPRIGAGPRRSPSRRVSGIG